MEIVTVVLGDRSYPIYIGPGAMNDPKCFVPHLAGIQVVVVTNETIAPLYLQKLVNTLGGAGVTTEILPDGEKHKTLATAERVLTSMLSVPCGRDVTVVALGGGVVGDIAGFAAACYQRGVAFVQVPTTLLAQVDSSVGGKTGVNHPLGKNMIGAFHQPRCVVVDTDSLRTLPDRDLRAGLAEVIKYGLIQDAPFFGWLEQNLERLLSRDDDALGEAVRRCCEDKAAIVAADEREQGLRAVLNLGHTFGHAIEAAVNYEGWLHGEAVAVGMGMAADLSCRLGYLSRPQVDRVFDLLQRAGLPLRPPAGIGVGRFGELMGRDKKVRSGKLRLVLLKDIGSAVVVDDFPGNALQDTLTHYCS